MLSTYAENLPVKAKQRYKEKLSAICGVDPFTLQAGKRSGPLEAAESLPQVDATDLVSYLVLQTNFVTVKQFKSHKSLEAYNQFVSGWVKEINSWMLTGSGPGKSVVTGRVSKLYAQPSCIIILCLDVLLTCMVMHIKIYKISVLLEKNAKYNKRIWKFFMRIN